MHCFASLPIAGIAALLILAVDAAVQTTVMVYVQSTPGTVPKSYPVRSPLTPRGYLLVTVGQIREALEQSASLPRNPPVIFCSPDGAVLGDGSLVTGEIEGGGGMFSSKTHVIRTNSVLIEIEKVSSSASDGGPDVKVEKLLAYGCPGEPVSELLKRTDCSGCVADSGSDKVAPSTKNLSAHTQDLVRFTLTSPIEPPPAVPNVLVGYAKEGSAHRLASAAVKRAKGTPVEKYYMRNEDIAVCPGNVISPKHVLVGDRSGLRFAGVCADSTTYADLMKRLYGDADMQALNVENASEKIDGGRFFIKPGFNGVVAAANQAIFFYNRSDDLPYVLSYSPLVFKGVAPRRLQAGDEIIGLDAAGLRWLVGQHFLFLAADFFIKRIAICNLDSTEFTQAAGDQSAIESTSKSVMVNVNGGPPALVNVCPQGSIQHLSEQILRSLGTPFRSKVMYLADDQAPDQYQMPTNDRRWTEYRKHLAGQTHEIHCSITRDDANGTSIATGGPFLPYPPLPSNSDHYKVKDQLAAEEEKAKRQAEEDHAKRERNKSLREKKREPVVAEEETQDTANHSDGEELLPLDSETADEPQNETDSLSAEDDDADGHMVADAKPAKAKKTKGSKKAPKAPAAQTTAQDQPGQTRTGTRASTSGGKVSPKVLIGAAALVAASAAAVAACRHTRS